MKFLVQKLSFFVLIVDQIEWTTKNIIVQYIPDIPGIKEYIKIKRFITGNVKWKIPSLPFVVN